MEKRLDDRITKAYNEFMTRLFGEVPSEPGTMTVDRETYTIEMHHVQDTHGLKPGDPDFLEWMLTLIGRSPVLTSEGEIVYDTGHPANPDRKEPPVGEAPPSKTE